MYGLIVAREVVRELSETGQLADEEIEVVNARIANLATHGEELTVQHILEAVFNGLNESARHFAREYDHSHLHDRHDRTRPSP